MAQVKTRGASQGPIGGSNTLGIAPGADSSINPTGSKLEVKPKRRVVG